MPRAFEVVIVPRASFGDYCGRPFAELMAAAEAKSDGLVVTSATFDSNGSKQMPRIEPGFASMYAGPQGQAFLYEQNW